MDPLKIFCNDDRLVSMLDSLSKLGATPTGGGVERTAFSNEDLLGRNWFSKCCSTNSLEYRQDGAGNQFARLKSTNPAAKSTLLLGSHLDTVPNGGRYDGSLGVTCALEVLLTLKDFASYLPFHLEAVNFTDEEGTLLSEFGSSAFTGQLEGILQNGKIRGGGEGTFGVSEMLKNIGISLESAISAFHGSADDLVGYLEVHIEQGNRLESSKTDIGVVTSIVGLRPFWFHFQGKAGHGGTTPLAQRKDALVTASNFISQAEIHVSSKFPGAVITHGSIFAQPGAFNVIPSMCKLAVEIRDETEAKLDALERSVMELANTIAEDRGLKLSVERLTACKAVKLNDKLSSILASSAKDLGLSVSFLPSFAGHDTQMLGRETDRFRLPCAMIFVPSINGLSHVPEENCLRKDIVNGGNVLLRSALQIAQKYEF